MRVSIENLVHQQSETLLSPEVFRDTDALHTAFLEHVAQPDWMEQQLLRNEQQKKIANDPFLAKKDQQNLNSADSMSYLNPVKRTQEERIQQKVSLEFMRPMYAFLFLEKGRSALDRERVNNLLFTVSDRLSYDVSWALQLKQPTDDELSQWGPAATAFIAELGLAELYTGANKALWAEALKEVVIFLNKLQRYSYCSFVADTAIGEIAQLIPEWRDIEPSLRAHLTIRIQRSFRGREYSAEGKYHHLLLTMGMDLNDLPSFLDDYFTAIHEATHAYVNEVFFQDNDLVPFYQVHGPQLMKVLQEACAIAVEQTLLRLYGVDNATQHTSFHGRTKDVLEELLARRDKTNTAANNVTHHVEGTRVARMLMKKGRKIEDIPQLIARIREFVAIARNTDNVSELANVSVSADPDSLYQQAIRSLA